jgi:hypothetical protein
MFKVGSEAVELFFEGWASPVSLWREAVEHLCEAGTWERREALPRGRGCRGLGIPVL